MKLWSSFVLLLVLTAGTAATQAQKAALRLDPASTQINFTLGATLHTVHGKFNLKSGSVEFDPATGAASGTIVVDVKSGDTGNKDRDGDMHKKVLESDRYPEATFTVKHMTGKLASQGASEIQVEGVLNLHGADHPMTLPFTVTATGDQLSATTHFEIPYVQWGMKDPSKFLLKVDKSVNVEITATGKIAVSQK